MEDSVVTGTEALDNYLQQWRGGRLALRAFSQASGDGKTGQDDAANVTAFTKDGGRTCDDVVGMLI